MNLYKKDKFINIPKASANQNNRTFKVFLLLIVFITILIALLTTRNLVFVKII